MSRPIKASVAKRYIEHLLEGVRTQGEQYEIQEGDETVAVLASPADFETLHQQQHLKEQAWKELEALLHDVHGRNAHIPPEQVAQHVVEAIRETRRHKDR